MNRGAKRISQIAALSVFFLFIVVYAFGGARDLIFGVKIQNVNITDGARVTESVLKITGNAKNATNLSLNGREISIDQEGNFVETIALLPGYNIISIVARDKFGYSNEKNYRVMLEK